MAPRAYWKGYLKLSLVSCPIALYPAASSSERVSFNRINKKTGNRLKQQLVDAETGDPVEKEDIGRGYEIGKGEYLLVEDDEIEKIKIESTHTIDIDSFVPRTEIDDRYLDSPYYIAPTDKVGQEAFAVIRDAIRDKGMVALGRVVLTRREHVDDARSVRKGLLGTTLRYPYEVREPAGYFEEIPDLKLPKEMKELAAPHRRHQGGPFRSQEVRGSLRDRAGRDAARQAGRRRVIRRRRRKAPRRSASSI